MPARRLSTATTIEEQHIRRGRDGQRNRFRLAGLQSHDPGSEMHYKNIRVKRLP